MKMHIKSQCLLCMYVCSHPLCVTRHWRSPNFLKISTVISMGVRSVTVKGLRSMIPLRRRGGGASGGWEGACSVKTTWEALTIPSWRFRALSERSGGWHLLFKMSELWERLGSYGKETKQWKCKWAYYNTGKVFKTAAGFQNLEVCHFKSHSHSDF